ncbi:GCN5 family acetyltransferase [Pluralibacter gergoviae]|uniref:GNAT family N-acetyltransferase n=1 Tax=Pluralibacter gergoviae TaxID=61647 RepID=UPI000650069C|nr:GNAT family N-acetyltransferase [Pluralibacter gergoviae]KMK27910.1 GCN5 family acetyltransferase [Pluralibacter gergoviae]
MERVTKPITPDAAGFADLKAESEAEKFHMLYRLEEHWRSGENRFSAPGEKLLGAFIDDRLIGVCGINRDPFSQHPRAGRIRHLYVSEKYRRYGAGRQLLAAVMADAETWFDFINTHAPETAHGFYQRVGFSPVLREPRITHRFYYRR